jgi:uncharacterized small protein (DUF1192 family)
MNQRFGALQEEIEDLKAKGGEDEIQQKLVEQNQLIGMLDE